ncbi:hypothetical protein ACJMK2_016567, partial [Sinanodonta woodiana]
TSIDIHYASLQRFKFSSERELEEINFRDSMHYRDEIFTPAGENPDKIKTTSKLKVVFA